jgi:hypothetical protein
VLTLERKSVRYFDPLAFRTITPSSESQDPVLLAALRTITSRLAASGEPMLGMLFDDELEVDAVIAGPAVSLVFTVSIGYTARFVTAAATPPPMKFAQFTHPGVDFALSMRENKMPLSARPLASFIVGVRGGLRALAST